MSAKEESHNTRDDLYSKYDLSCNGFLPSDEPLRMLPVYFRSWDELANDLSVHINNGTLRDQVEKLELLDSDKLSTIEEVRRAYSILSMIAHGYVWRGEPITSIPKQLAVPWVAVSKRLGINPILTHATVDLYNWYLIDPNGEIELDNLRSLHTFTGTFDEEWFYLIMVDIEKRAAPLLDYIINMSTLMEQGETETIKRDLIDISRILDEMTKVLRRMKEKCKPTVFYNDLRPFLSGWGGDGHLKDGMIYEGVSDQPVIYVGGSAAQSSIFPVLDALFDVQHNDKYFVRIRDHMPGSHREFINYVTDHVSISDYVKDHGELRESYNDCVQSLRKFRQGHMALVRRYIFEMAGSKNVKGSGLTEVKEFLKGAIKETRDTKM